MRILRPTVLALMFLLAAASACAATPEQSNAEKLDEELVASTDTTESSANSADALDSGGDPGIELPDELPIAAAVTDIAGYTEIDVTTAVNNARFDSIVTCMTTQGWEFGYADLPEAGPSTEPISYFGNQIQYYLDQIDVVGADSEDNPSSQETESDQSRDSIEFDQDQFECWIQAENEFPNPLEPLWAWIAEETTDLNTRVTQDNRIAAARKVSSACFAASGYEFTTVEAAGNHFNELADQIWVRFTSGAITGDAARSELLPISDQLDELGNYVRACDIELAAVQEKVRAEYEEAFLSANGTRIALLAADYSELLTMYLDFLPARLDG